MKSYLVLFSVLDSSMGSCWSSFLAEFAKIRRPIDYIGRSQQARAARYSVRDRGDGIEFDNLLSEDDYEIQTKPKQKVLTDEECTFINQKRYGDLAKKQSAVNAQIDEKLNRHEDNLRLEEEKEYAAKREAVKLARQKRANELKASHGDTEIKKILDDSAFASWLSDDEDDDDDDHDLDTQEFGEFLARVQNLSNTNINGDHSNLEELDHLEKVKSNENAIDALERWSPTFENDED